MTQLRAPRVAGVGGGVGTTTLATALRGHDRGRALDQGVDVLVCRSTGESLHAAATVVNWLVSAGQPRPVLAITSDSPIPVRGPLRARLRMMEPQVAGLVVLPYVSHWRELTDPLAQVVQLSDCPAEQLPKALRGYGLAIGQLAETVLRCGLLHPAHGARALPPGLPDLGPRGPSATNPRCLGGPDTGGQGRITDTGPGRGTDTGPNQPVGGIGDFGFSVASAVLYGGVS